MDQFVVLHIHVGTDSCVSKPSVLGKLVKKHLPLVCPMIMSRDSKTGSDASVAILMLNNH